MIEHSCHSCLATVCFPNLIIPCYPPVIKHGLKEIPPFSLIKFPLKPPFVEAFPASSYPEVYQKKNILIPTRIKP
jgi:hypothetical protein